MFAYQLKYSTIIVEYGIGSDVVLGPCQPICYIRTETGIPAEQAVARQKLRPGSGTLNLAVETDGPTRVLRIIDVENPPRRNFLHHTFEDNDYNTTPKCRIKIDLLSGLGISIVSCNPREELLYGRFSGFVTLLLFYYNKYIKVVKNIY